MNLNFQWYYLHNIRISVPFYHTNLHKMVVGMSLSSLLWMEF